MPTISTTVPSHLDTSHRHLDCLAREGWLSFDVSSMGDPDGYLMTPCCIHGYRAVYSARPKLSWKRWNKTRGLAKNFFKDHESQV